MIKRVTAFGTKATRVRDRGAQPRPLLISQGPGPRLKRKGFFSLSGDIIDLEYWSASNPVVPNYSGDSFRHKVTIYIVYHDRHWVPPGLVCRFRRPPGLGFCGVQFYVQRIGA